MGDWFGYHAGRELGNPFQYFEPDQNKLITFVEDCRKNNKPAFMSVTPRKEHNVIYGVDRLYFDFDAKEEKDRQQMEYDVKRFVNKIEIAEPLIVKTFHGYHVYLFFKDGCIQTSDNQHAKDFYVNAQHLLLNGDKYNQLCTKSLYKVMGMARIPLSWHEAGCECIIVNRKLEPIKVRGLDYYTMYGLDSEFIDRVVKLMKIAKEYKKEIQNQYTTPEVGGVYGMRPCFDYALQQKEMGQMHRLALVIEAYYAGKSVEEIKNLFKSRRDYDPQKTNYQVEWEVKKIREEYLKPWKCETLINNGWCIKHNCPIWVKRNGDK